MDQLATIPRLKKLNLSRNSLDSWSGTVSFPHLTELYFAFNSVQKEDDLRPALVYNLNVALLVVTGNPFAQNNDTSHLQKILSDRFNG